VGWKIYENQYFENKQGGSTVAQFPYAAGTQLTTACTRTEVQEARPTSAGGLRLRLKLMQAGWCLFPQYSAKIRARHPNNPTTQISVDSRGNLAYYPLDGGSWKVSQGEGLAVPPGLILGVAERGGKSYFLVGSSAIQVTAINGAIATVNTGQMAIASKDGVKVVPIPPLEYRFDKFMGKSPSDPYAWGRLYVEEPNTGFVNGRPVRNGGRVQGGRIEVRSP
jgi:hypothetical protein